jgi:hypothetical protein
VCVTAEAVKRRRSAGFDPVQKRFAFTQLFACVPSAERSIACGDRVTFLLRGHDRAGSAGEQRSWPEGRRAGSRNKRKVPKTEGHPASALSRHPARKVRGRVTGSVDRASGNRVLRCLNSGIHAVACPDAKLAGIHAGHPAGFPPPARRCRGAPDRATRILRVLSEEPDQKRNRIAYPATRWSTTVPSG